MCFSLTNLIYTNTNIHLYVGGRHPQHDLACHTTAACKDRTSNLRKKEFMIMSFH